MTAEGRARGDRARLAVSVTQVGLRRRVSSALGPWLARSAPRAARGAVTVALVGDARMRGLNRTFRGMDRTTDVLSFPSGEPDGGDLGEIAIAVGVARRQASAPGHALGVELRILALHGLLHLLGYDHEQDHGAMRRFEERLRRRAGLPAGLIARGRRPRAHS
jgi:probable rRNA maturation factor